MSTLHARLVDLARQDPEAVALIGPDGARWTRAALLDRAAMITAAGPGPGANPRPDEPVATVVDQLAAQAGGDPVLHLHTSGGTSRAKSISRTAGSWLASVPVLDRLVTAAAGAERSGRLLWAPGGPSSTLTLYALWQGLATGVPVLAGGEWRGVPQALRGPADRSVLLHAVPVVLEAVLDELEGRAGRRAGWLRVAVVAGAAPSPTLRRRCTRLGVHLVEYYGAAELSFVAVDVDGSGLRPFPGVQVKVHDGALRARSPYLAETVDGQPVADDEGWAGVGDRAVLLPHGVLRLRGRPGTANVGGHTVHLADVEAVLAAVPGVAEVVCLGVADPLVGERVTAVVRPDPGIDPVAALRAAAASLPTAARPARHHLVSELPRTSSGKVDRAALADRWAAALR